MQYAGWDGVFTVKSFVVRFMVDGTVFFLQEFRWIKILLFHSFIFGNFNDLTKVLYWWYLKTINANIKCILLKVNNI